LFCNIYIEKVPEGAVPIELTPSFYARLLDSLHDGVYFVDNERRILYWNKGAELLSGYTAEETVGRLCAENLLEHVDSKGCALCMGGCPLSEAITDGRTHESDIFLRHKQGHRVAVSVRVSPITDAEGKIAGAVEIFSDLSVKKSFERRVIELENLAFLDALTGVHNRRYIELKVAQTIQEVEQFGRRSGVLLFDVDNFKNVNDRYGHQVGDQVLMAICNTLNKNQRLGDMLGRWGGEEFLLIVRDVNPATLAACAERCRALVASTFVILEDGGQVNITASVGATMLRNGDTGAAVIKRVDELMYKAKSGGRNCVSLD
jgi:diguanylate cyclase (GGDEF)-like protein/PAS domain S-box-containing protein